jgi:ABC-type tungstate transport system permease subunit
MEPVEYEYFQLINGKMYPAKIKDKKLVASKTPLSVAVTNSDKSVTNTQTELLHKQTDIDTVSAKALDLSQIRVEWIEE